MIRLTLPKEFESRTGDLLSKYTSLKVGGRADRVVPVYSQQQLCRLRRFCLKHSVRFFTLGGGTNVFFSDQGFAGVIALIRFARLEPCGKYEVLAEAGVRLSRITRFCLRHNLTGFEFATGIPGTLGGAVCGNAGAYGRTVGDLVLSARILDERGRVRDVERGYFEFAYRHSRLKNSPVHLLQARLRLERGEPGAIRARVSEISVLRRSKLPDWHTATAGSYFKNLKDEKGGGVAAAVYLDAVDSKNASVNDAAVHPKHANIFYNKGRARAADFLALEDLLRTRVENEFGIRLEREVIYVE